jgi:type VI secretion system protein ImpM
MPGDPMSAAPVRIGFFGKVPSRGDFVRAGLSWTFVQAWDDWLQTILPACQRLIGDAWDSVWCSAPSWRFALPAGHCGTHAIIGLLLPSMDRAGRHFPLTIAAEGADHGTAFLDGAERIGWDAVHGAFEPGMLQTRLAAIAPPHAVPPNAPPATGARWWSGMGTEGTHAAIGFVGLPEAAAMAGMLRQ